MADGPGQQLFGNSSPSGAPFSARLLIAAETLLLNVPLITLPDAVDAAAVLREWLARRQAATAPA